MKSYKMNILEHQDKVLVTGGTGMIGKALQKVMPNAMYVGSEYDLIDYRETMKLFDKTCPKYVIHLAARVSGMKGNMDAIGEHYTENVLMNTNVLEASRVFNVQKLLSVLSTCIYPNDASLPLVEEDIHYGEPHPTNLGYGFSKRMVDIQSRTYRKQYGSNYVGIVPNNLFGENDNFHLVKSHVIPSVIRKVYEAKKNKTSLILWGDGSPLREFTYSGDLAKIIIFSFNKYNGEHPINVGNPGEYSIKELAEIVCEILDYKEPILWNTSVSNGQPRKPSDNTKFLDLGWKSKDYTDFRTALQKTCGWFLDNYPNVRGVE
jgi:GDP-L-fucose synthase